MRFKKGNQMEINFSFIFLRKILYMSRLLFSTFQSAYFIQFIYIIEIIIYDYSRIYVPILGKFPKIGNCENIYSKNQTNYGETK